MKLYAWIGPDEFGSGKVGLKQGRVPAGYIPLVVMDYDRAKIESPEVVAGLTAQAKIYGVTIRLAEFTLSDDSVRILAGSH